MSQNRLRLSVTSSSKCSLFASYNWISSTAYTEFTPRFVAASYALSVSCRAQIAISQPEWVCKLSVADCSVFPVWMSLWTSLVDYLVLSVPAWICELEGVFASRTSSLDEFSNSQWLLIPYSQRQDEFANSYWLLTCYFQPGWVCELKAAAYLVFSGSGCLQTHIGYVFRISSLDELQTHQIFLQIIHSQ